MAYPKLDERGGRREKGDLNPHHSFPSELSTLDLLHTCGREAKIRLGANPNWHVNSFFSSFECETIGMRARVKES